MRSENEIKKRIFGYKQACVERCKRITGFQKYPNKFNVKICMACPDKCPGVYDILLLEWVLGKSGR